MKNVKWNWYKKIHYLREMSWRCSKSYSVCTSSLPRNSSDKKQKKSSSVSCLAVKIFYLPNCLTPIKCTRHLKPLLGEKQKLAGKGKKKKDTRIQENMLPKKFGQNKQNLSSTAIC